MTALDPEEHDYLVIVEHTTVYRVFAESPEEAAQIIDNGDYDTADEIEVVGSRVESVVAGDGYWLDEDLRAPKSCAGGCGTLMAANQPSECTWCLLQRLERERAARAGRS